MHYAFIPDCIPCKNNRQERYSRPSIVSHGSSAWVGPPGSCRNELPCSLESLWNACIVIKEILHLVCSSASLTIVGSVFFWQTNPPRLFEPGYGHVCMPTNRKKYSSDFSELSDLKPHAAYRRQQSQCSLVKHVLLINVPLKAVLLLQWSN